MKTEQELLTLKGTIEKAKVAVSELNGQKSALVKQLEEYGCKTISEAETKLSAMEKEISDIDKQIEQGTKDLEAKYQLQ